MMFLIPQRVFFFTLFFIPFFSSAQTTAPAVQTQDVYYCDFARNTFYTWTTPAQIDSLRKNKKLLVKSKSETRGYSAFDMALRDERMKHDTIARILQQECFAKKRFAWTSGWATVMGCKGEKYGHHLIRIVLSDSAIIGKFDFTNMYDTFTFYDMQGNKLSKEYVIKNQHRIAAIYHVNNFEGQRKQFVQEKKGTFFRDTKRVKSSKALIRYREYVIMNENMIKEWSYGTAAIKDELNAETQLLKALKTSGKATQEAYSVWINYWYEKPVEYPDASDIYRNSICFANDYYLFNEKRLDVIINELSLVIKEQKAELKK